MPRHGAQEDVERLRPAGGATLCVTAEADPAVLRPQTAAEARLYSQLAQGAAEKQRSGGAAAKTATVRQRASPDEASHAEYVCGNNLDLPSICTRRALLIYAVSGTKPLLQESVRIGRLSRRWTLTRVRQGLRQLASTRQRLLTHHKWTLAAQQPAGW